MKKVLFFALLTTLSFLSVNSFSQREIKNGDYIKNDNINKFVGSWQWISGDTSFIIVLEKEKKTLKSDKATINTDAIKGWHKYLINGEVIENTVSSDVQSISGIIARDGTENKLTIFFDDITKSKSGRAILEFLPGEKDKAQWILKGTPGVKILDVGQVPDYTFTVPTNVMMERVKNKNK
jgi:hypothetical protein